MPKASIGVALIARNAEKTIGACLDSIVPYVEQVVVCVDETTSDTTAQVARDHGAEVYEGHVVSEIHECEYHGKILAQHFANARQESFKHLRSDLDFHMWLDADDVVEGGEKLYELVSKLSHEVAGVWLPYDYAKAGDNGPVSTLFDRERIVRSSMPWKWQHRVHEILVPIGTTTEQLNWTRTDNIRIVHQHIGHDTAGSARRNITLLEIDLEEDANDMRAWFYLGNQYFALNEWNQAIDAYEKSCESENPYQLWQTLIYLSMAYEKLGAISVSRQSAFRALEIQPQHPEPYYRLASTYMMVNDVERTEFWTHLGDQMPEPPFFVFRNPLDRPYNARLTLATVYANNGMISRARRELERAAKAIPSKEVLDGIAYHRKTEEDSMLADAWVKVMSSHEHPPEKRNGITDDVWKFGRVRDMIVPNVISHRSSTQPRIIFFCGKSIEPWAPVSLNTTGIGGSETAVIQIAKRFAADGYRVDVYNDCDCFEGEYDDVGYWDTRRLLSGEQTDIFVSWRNPAAHALPINRKLSLLWCHDLHSGVGIKEHLARWDRVLGVSGWHRDHLSKVYGISHTDFVPNGIELERFAGRVDKIPFRCVYASSPDRGLPNLLRMWSNIVESEPKAELHVAYGWENIDKSIALGMDQRGQLAELKRVVVDLIEKTPGVVWRGRLPQDELAKLYKESYAMLYPTSFTETFCINAVEAMAGGCVPVVSAVGALPDTVGDGGLVVTGNTYTQAWKEFYVLCARSVLQSPRVRIPMAHAGIKRSEGMSWDRSFEKWRGIVMPVLEGREVACLSL